MSQLTPKGLARRRTQLDEDAAELDGRRRALEDDEAGYGRGSRQWRTDDGRHRGPGRRPREAADQGGARAGRQSHQGGRGLGIYRRLLYAKIKEYGLGVISERAEILKALTAGPISFGASSATFPTRPSARPAPGEWAIVRVVAHLADTEERTIGRTRRMLSEDEPAPPYDPDELAIKRGTSRWRWPTSWIGSRRCA